jgi:sec-independent protein translocase protein TatA
MASASGRAALLEITAMGSYSLTHWLVVLAVVLIVFGAGRLPKAMGELAKGIRSFRTGMREEASSGVGEDLSEVQPARRDGS